MSRLVIIASGPSTTDDDIERVRNARCDVLVINENYLRAPWADYCYGTDVDWWEHHGSKMASLFQGELLTITDVNDGTGQDKRYAKVINDYNMTGIVGCNGVGLRTEKDKIYFNGNSTGAAMNWAYHKGYDTIILLGVEMKGKQPQEYTNHAFPDREECFKRRGVDYVGFRDALDKLVRDLRHHGVTVINCSRNSALKSVPYTPIEEVL